MTYRDEYPEGRHVRQDVGKGMELPHSLQMLHSPSTSKHSPTQKLSKSSALGIFMEASSCQHDWSLTPFPAPLPSLENRRWGWKFQASNHGLIFLMPSTSPGAHTSHLIRIKDTAVTQEIPRDLGTLCQEPGSKTNLRTKDAPSILIT